MKTLALFFTIGLLTLSCHKNKNAENSCKGQFITAAHYWKNSAIIYKIDTDSGEVFDNYGGSEMDDPAGEGSYIYEQNCFYLFAGHRLLKYNFKNNSRTYLGESNALPSLKSQKINQLFYNGTENNFYLIIHTVTSDLLYKINLDSGYSEKKLYAADSGVITSPVVDEKTGNFYFVTGLKLMKVDPVSGAPSVAATYSNVRPSNLQYNRNDGLFYGVNEFGYPYQFISIDPTTCAVKIIGALNFLTPGEPLRHTFDYCHNQYILQSKQTYWLDLSNAHVAKQINKNLLTDLHYIVLAE